MSMASPRFQPLLEVRRSGLAEVEVYGSFAWAHGNQVLKTNADAQVFARSCLKPVAVRALHPATDSWSLTDLAIATASHNGTAAHLAAVHALVADEDRLLLPPSLPLVQGETPVLSATRGHHSCSGEHAAVVRASAHFGWSGDYRGTEHPFWQRTVAEARRLLHLPDFPQQIAEDGCGLPTPALSVSQLARLYAGLARTRSEDRLWTAMCAHPELVGGRDRLDTRLLVEGQGRLLAKEGADGLLAVAIDHPEYPQGLGLAIKVAHGWDPRGTAFIVAAALQSIGIPVAEPEAPRLQTLHLCADVGL